MSVAGTDPPRRIYLDNAATTPILPEVADAIRAAMDVFGNPSSRHRFGEDARDLLDACRADVAGLLGCDVDELVFTSGGSESIGAAVVGTALHHEGSGQVVTSAIEHSAVIESCRLARSLGMELAIVPVGRSGVVDPDDVRRAIRADTRLVSIMHCNNETGVLQPVDEIARVVHEAGARFHTDAVQSAGKRDLTGLEADLVSISGHKFHAPKGVGSLLVDEGCELAPVIRGGGQESGRRSGTENMLGIVGMAAAAVRARRVLSDPGFQEQRVRRGRRLIDGLRAIGDVEVNGDDASRVPETVNACVLGVRGDALVDLLALEGVAISAGSACHAGTDEPSHVLTAMGIPAELARSAVRISLGTTTTDEDLEEALSVMSDAVHRLRAMSPATLRARDSVRTG